MANRMWAEGEIGYVEIVSPTYGRYVCKVDAGRLEELAQHNWTVSGSSKAPRYAATWWIRDDGSRTTKRMHAFLFPDAPEGEVRDHINGDGFDNRQENIRFVTTAHNSLNRTRRKRLPGVVLTRGLYRAHFTVGHFVTEAEAHEAWKSAYLKVHGKLPECVEDAVTLLLQQDKGELPVG